MRTKVLTLLAATAALLLAGCQIWKPGGVQHKTADGAVSVMVPSGWMFTTATGLTKDSFLATKDGALLQRLVLSQHEIKDPLPHSKRQLVAGQSPYETAEALIDDLRSNREMHSLRVIENTPIDVGGAAGFRLIIEYGVAEPAGLKIREVRHGVLVDSKLYQLTFVAPARHYFERDLPVFDVTAKTIQVARK